MEKVQISQGKFKSNIKKTHIATLLIIILLTITNSCLASSIIYGKVTSYAPQKMTAELWMGKKLVLRLRQVGNSHPGYEVETIAKRIEKIIDIEEKQPPVKVERFYRRYIITIKGKYILTVTNAQARLNNTTPKALAEIWAHNIREGLKNLPTMKLVPSATVVPLGGKRVLKLKGNYHLPLTLKPSHPQLVGLCFNPKTKSITIYGHKTGWTSLTVKTRDISAKANIWVKDWPGILPTKVNTKVTGTPAGRTILEEALLSDLLQNTLYKLDAYLKIDRDDLSLPSTLSPGESIELNIGVHIWGKNYIPIERKIPVRISNIPLSKEKASFLMVSNRPETITHNGQIFSADFPNRGPVRLLFHHRNSPGQKNRFLIVKLLNNSSQPTKLHFIKGISGPEKDEINVGHIATYRFLSCLHQNEGRFIHLRPQSKYHLVMEKLPPEATMAGLLQIKVLEGDLPSLVIEAKENTSTINPSAELVRKPAVEVNYSQTKGVFSSPNLYLERKFTVGEAFTYIPIGKKPFLREISTGEPNRGNYGVIYNIKIKIHNPTPKKQSAKICFVPTAGIAKGTFIINGEIVRAPLTNPFEEFILKKVPLKPFATKELSLLTTPQSGSFYPVNLVIRT